MGRRVGAGEKEGWRKAGRAPRGETSAAELGLEVASIRGGNSQRVDSQIRKQIGSNLVSNGAFNQTGGWKNQGLEFPASKGGKETW